jgi:hypothetical protein
MTRSFEPYVSRRTAELSSYVTNEKPHSTSLWRLKRSLVIGVKLTMRAIPQRIAITEQHTEVIDQTQNTTLGAT